MDLNKLQTDVHEWANDQFGPRQPSERLIGAAEEFGELFQWKLEEIVPLLHAARSFGKTCHHHLKEDQGIKGSPEFHRAKIKDSLGDIFIFLIDYCELRGWSYEDIIRETWEEVSQRDYKNDPKFGLARYEGQDER